MNSSSSVYPPIQSVFVSKYLAYAILYSAFYLQLLLDIHISIAIGVYVRYMFESPKDAILYLDRQATLNIYFSDFRNVFVNIALHTVYILKLGLRD